MSEIPGRALHYVFKIGDRAKTMHFFRNILGMKVLRHEEFKEGCEAQCNGPYDNRWSKTMIGYGPESSHFVIELTYNYGVTSYDLGNEFGGITIKSNEILKRATQNKYPITVEKNVSVLTAPDGYKFYIIDEEQPDDKDPLQQVALNVTDLALAKKFWHQTLQMQLLSEDKESVVLSYGENQCALRLQQLTESLKRATAYGRIAFAVPKANQEPIEKIVKAANGRILKPLVVLETPGKANVQVIILGDPDGHEICFVDEEGFGELSAFDETGNAMLDKYIGKDPFQDKN